MALLPLPVAGSQTLATTVPLVLPSAIAFDTQGNLYVSQTASHIVSRVDTAGNITTVAGTGTQGFAGDGDRASAALLDSPQGLAVNATSLYIADSHNHRVRKVGLASGTITTAAGSSTAGASGDGGQAANANLDLPTSLALDSDGNLYIADAGTHRIRRVSANGVITTVAGTGIQGFDGDGAATAVSLDSPGGIAVDAAGNLYIADTHNGRIRRLNLSTGTLTTLAGTGAQGFAGDANLASTAKLALPRGVSLDQQGNLYIADTANHRIRRVDTVSGVITTIAGDGVQAFSGDGGPPTSASLDSPHATALSSGSSLNFADTGNARVRQVVNGSTLQTVAGLGATTPGVLTLAGPSVISYGTGSLTASLNSSSTTGTVTFLDNYLGVSNKIGSATLAGNTASLDTSMLPAGQHSVMATYVDDQTHASAQSALFALTVNPIELTASVTPTSIVYGQPVPTLTGTLNGVLPRDQPAVSATYSTSAGTFSPAGSYPITVALAGAAAGNYALTSTPSLTVAKAAALTTLTVTAPQLVNASTVSASQPLILAVHVASATAGQPTGTVTILDGSSTLSSASVNASGDAILTIGSSSAGAHSFTAAYSGDGNFNAGTSSPTLITVDAPSTAAPDFSLATTGGTTQTIIAGNSASFSFLVQPQGSLSSQVSLAATGVPNLATVSFNPAYVPPGSTSTPVVLSIVTPKTARLEYGKSRVVFAFLLSPFAAGILLRLRGRRLPLLAVIVFVSTLPMLTGCGDRIYTGNATQASATYTITVTGTATSATGTAIQHAATVTLVVVPAS